MPGLTRATNITHSERLKDLVSNMDLSALAGVTPDQVELIARLLQSGQLKVNNEVPTSSSVRASANDAHNSLVSERSHLEETENMDKEDGELEEGELGESDRSERGFLRPPSPGLRVLDKTPRDSYGLPRRKLSPNPPSARRRTSSRDPPMTASFRAELSSPKQSKSAEAKAFVLVLHASGYSFEDVARHLGDSQLLRRIFQELGLPQEGSKLHGTTQFAQPNTSSSRMISNEARKRVPVPHKPAPADRNEYLARLAAAKNKTIPAAPAAPSPPVAAVRDDAKPSSSAPVAIIAEPEVEMRKSSSATKPTYRREFIKQRMEALMAERAANKAAKEKLGLAHTAKDMSSKHADPESIPVPNGSTPAKPQDTPGADGLEAGLVTGSSLSDLKGVPAAQNVPLTATPSPLQGGVPLCNEAGNSTPLSAGPFGHLPGLFMTSFNTLPPHVPQSPASSTPVARPVVAEVGQKRPLSEDSFSGDASPNAAKRLFGMSRHQSPERGVIQLSEDDDDDDDNDDEGEDMEIDTYGLSPSLDSTNSSHVNESRPDSQRAVHSGTATPANGPSQYQRKLEEIEEIKRRIAEKERAKFGKAIIAGATQDDSVSTATKNVLAESTESLLDIPLGPSLVGRAPSAPLDPAQHSTVPAAPLDGTMSAAAVARQQEKARLQSRLQELQSSVDRQSSDTGHTPTRNEGLDGERLPAAPRVAVQHNDFSKDAMGFAASPFSPQAKPRQVSNESGTRLDQGDKVLDFTSDAAQSTYEQSTMAPSNVLHDNQPTDVETNDGDVADQSPGSSDAASDAEATVQDGNNASPSLESGADEEETDEEETDESTSDDEMDESDGPDDDSDYGQNTTAHAAQNDSENMDDDDSHPEDYAVDMAPIEEEYLGLAEHTESVNDGIANVGNLTELGGDADQPKTSPPSISTEQVQQPQAKSYYTPYQSPLARFQDYKFHGDYLTKVPSGYGSLTYNHQVDPTKFICPYEATGGRCNDKHCEHQHFHSLGLSDDDLLKSLVSQRPPNCTVEDYPRWREGLARLIQELRSASLGRDASTIAAKIAQYRREFTGDATKTINLDRPS